MLLESKAIAKIQAAVLATVAVVAAVIGSIAYVMWVGTESADTITIGVLADLDNTLGRNTWQGVVLAAEQINAEGGILGRQVEVVGEDHDMETTQDMVKLNLALTRLIAYRNVDFIIAHVDGEAAFVSQDVVAEHKKILLAVAGSLDALTQRVIDDYDKYKYYFKVGVFNGTSMFQGMTDSLLLLREQTGFNKVGYLAEDLLWNKGIRDGFDNVLTEVHGFDLVYKETFPLGTFDFSSYLARAEAAGVEVLLPLFWANNGVPLAKEWYDRQSPLLIYGGILAGINNPAGWEVTDGKCEHIIVASAPITAGYPLTSKTLAAREAYINRWGEAPWMVGGSAYDILRYVLPDAIERARTIESDAVVEALEETSIEISGARNFVFTSSHDVMIGENPWDPDADYMLMCLFQWQNGEMVPVYPKKIMEEAGATYTYPLWKGPWSK